ncbi:MAG: RNA polymerase factor sigma-54 [Planctomycetes bacterium]|nr:RNA polymerase factor sigma-54 [Planctomycetota bacterium]
MTPGISQSFGQYMRMEQKLTPQLIQSMSILQLNAMALENRVAEELEKNFALEEGERVKAETNGSPGDVGTQDQNTGDINSESFQRLDRLTREYGSDDARGFANKVSRAAMVGERDAKLDAMANAASRPESLTEHLMVQWAVLELDDETRRAGEAIIYSLEDDGYLRVHLDEIAADGRPPLDEDALAVALEMVQRLDPVGVAARDYHECLLLQLEAQRGDNKIEQELVRNHLRDVVRNRFPAISKATGYSVGEITEAVKAMQSTLHLHPGYTVVDREIPRITPDVIIDDSESGGGFDVRLTRSSTPQLRISHSAVEMLKDKSSSKEVRDFVRKHLEAATALMDAIKFRRDRLLVVAERIVERQADFFEVGPEGLKVLRMSELAEELECDPSTISRTVAGKYVQTPRGIFPMRYFFTGGTESSSGESTSWDSIKSSVQKLIEGEDTKDPFNDDQVATLLNKSGIDISRRTVAKYRQQLGIPSSRQRKKF